jgi:acetylornithine deacetylase/succinyl-diaminopimelate desuccinylase family protein
MRNTGDIGDIGAMGQALTEIIAGYEDAMVAFTSDLIAIASENPPGLAYRACVDRIATELAAFGQQATLIETRGIQASEPGYCLTSGYGEDGAGTPTLYFHGHYDVVPAVHEEQFQPYGRDGRLYGRGSSDMKGGIAAMIYALRALKERRIPLAGRVALMLVPDEETGGDRGSRALVEMELLGRDGVGMLTAEPTDGAIWNAHRGAISLSVTVHGRPAHVGLHYLGVNAFEQMLRVADVLSELKREVAARQTGYHIEPEAARGSILMMGGRSEGGSNFNLVPESCMFTVDRRINPEEDLASEKQRLLDVFDRLRQEGIDLEVDIFQEAPSAGIDEQHSLAQALARNVARVTGQAPSFALCPGLLETRWYAQRGVPAFAYGPGLLTVSHGPEEYIPIENLTQAATIYALTACDTLAGTEG